MILNNTVSLNRFTLNGDLCGIDTRFFVAANQPRIALLAI